MAAERGGRPELKELLSAVDPFARLVRLHEGLNVPDELPLSRIVPGVWPSVGELRRLVIAVQRLSGSPDDPEDRA
jgi:hypothetical protein